MTRNHPLHIEVDKALKELGSIGANEKAKKIFALLARHADQNGKARILVREIATETHISATIVKDKIGFLVHQGFLKVSKEFVNTDIAHYYRNVYTINPRFLRHMPAACCESEPNSESRSKTNEIQGLARLGIVMADVVKEIFTIYEENNKKEESK